MFYSFDKELEYPRFDLRSRYIDAERILWMPHNLALFPRRAHDWVADPVGDGSSWCLALPSFKNHDGGARRVRGPRRSAISSPPKFGFAFLKGLRNGSEWREMMVCTSCQHLAWYPMCRGLQGFVKCSEISNGGG